MGNHCHLYVGTKQQTVESISLRPDVALSLSPLPRQPHRSPFKHISHLTLPQESSRLSIPTPAHPLNPVPQNEFSRVRTRLMDVTVMLCVTSSTPRAGPCASEKQPRRTCEHTHWCPVHRPCGICGVSLPDKIFTPTAFPPPLLFPLTFSLTLFLSLSPSLSHLFLIIFFTQHLQVNHLHRSHFEL